MRPQKLNNSPGLAYNALGQDLKFLTGYDKEMHRFHKNTNVGATNAKKL
jgi:hypothetical protein